MPIAVHSVLGLGGIPNDRTSASRWLTDAKVPVTVLRGDKRRPEMVELSDLPDEVRRAVLEREIEASGLSVGTSDALDT